MRPVSLARLLALALTLSLWNVSALAEDEWESIEREGHYFSAAASVGSLLEISDLEQRGTGANVNTGPSGGLSLVAGHRFGSWFGAEAEFEVMSHNVDVEGGPGTREFKGETFAFNAAGRIYLARSENGELWSSIGIGLLSDGKEGDVAFAYRASTGFDIYVSDETAFFVAASYVLPTGDLHDFDYVVGRFGILKRF